MLPGYASSSLCRTDEPGSFGDGLELCGCKSLRSGIRAPASSISGTRKTDYIPLCGSLKPDAPVVSHALRVIGQYAIVEEPVRNYGPSLYSSTVERRSFRGVATFF